MSKEQPDELKPEQLEKIRETMEKEMREKTGSPYATLSMEEAKQRLEREKIEANLEAQKVIEQHPEIFGQEKR